ncbi:alpha amylase C-terminal domain-containing protein [Pistricoccus aurantiacus]|nr:alpha amylase C-terminal domain-containing protein [Pistricoccus aurantiacus]
MAKPESIETSPLIEETAQPTRDDDEYASEGLTKYRWHDDLWLRQREQVVAGESPLAIYRLEPLDWLASWQGIGKEKISAWQSLDWKALGIRLIPHMADLGFTHLELTRSRASRASKQDAVNEDTVDATVFANFIDTCHEGGLGVIVEIRVLQEILSNVPSEQKTGAAAPDSALSDNDRLASLLDAIRRYHLDGVSLADDTDEAGGLALMSGLAQTAPDVLLIVDASLYSSLYKRLPTVSRLLVHNAGWNRVMLEFLSEPPDSRHRRYPALIDSFSHACDAPYLLPLTNPGARHPWLARIPGDRWQRFATLRAATCLMWTYPGKKLLGMGTEFGQDRPRQADQSLDWTLLDDGFHAGMLRLVADLNRLYGDESALHGCDGEPSTVEWVVNDDTTNNVVAFLRHGAEGTAPLLVVANFTPRVQRDYRLGVPNMGAWYEVINSDSVFYGGSNVGNGQAVMARMTASHGYPASLDLTLPPLGTLLLKQGDWPA